MVAKTRFHVQKRAYRVVFYALACILLVLGIFQSFQDHAANVEIVYDQNLISLSPFEYTDFNNSRLNYIYEALVTYSEDLKIVPKLAVAFGEITPTQYLFKIKDNIYLHNQKHVDSDFIIQYFKDIQQVEALASLTQNIDNLQRLDDYSFYINLKQADALFLAKLANLAIADSSQISDLKNNPVGTGPFILKGQTANQIYLEPFQSYHGNTAKFEQLLLTSIPNQTQRLDYALTNPSVLAIFGMSPVFKERLNINRFSLQNYIEGSTNFFLYNYNRPMGKTANFRTQLQMALSLDMDFESFTQGMGKDSSQFLASGVFGYNPAIKDSTDLQAIEYQNYQPQILLPKNFEKIAERLTIALEKHSIYPQFSFENLYELEPKQVSRNYDLIFFGFKSDFFDGQSLFESFRPDSKFNYGNYNSQEFNQLVEQLTETTKIKPRQKLLQDLSQKILDPQKPLGVPLFENQVYYALSKNYQLNPRLDGYLDLSLISY